MAKDVFWTATTFIIIFVVLVLAFWPADKSHVTVKFDCSIVEENPNTPTFVKEECKKRSTK